jgi:hypothetical protein
MLVKICPVPLAQHVHGNAQQADKDLNATECKEHDLEPAQKHPIIREIGQDKAEEVLEDEQAGERFNCDVSVRVCTELVLHHVRDLVFVLTNKILGRRDGAHDHTDDNESKEDIRHNPAIVAHITRRDAEAEQTNCGEDECW